MKSILSDLFFGKILPYEQVTPKTKKYKEACKEYNGACIHFEKRLKEEAPSLFAQWQEIEGRYLTISQMDEAAAFSFGFRLGAKLMEEIYGKNNDKQMKRMEKELKNSKKKARRRRKPSRRAKKQIKDQANPDSLPEGRQR